MKAIISFFVTGALLLASQSGCSSKKLVPAVEGLELRAAIAKLEQSGLKVGQVAKQFTGTKDSGTVLAQWPGAAQKVVAGAAIDLRVEESITVPDLLGLDLDSAMRALANQGLRLEKVDTNVVTGKAPGTVLAQMPLSGARVAATTSGVAVVLASAKPSIAVRQIKEAGTVRTIKDEAADTAADAASDAVRVAVKKGIAGLVDKITHGGKKKPSEESTLHPAKSGTKSASDASGKPAGGKTSLTNTTVAVKMP